MIFKPKRGPSNLITTIVPENGEMLYAMDTRELFIGDGKTPGGKFIGIVPKEITAFDPQVKKEDVSKSFDSMFDDVFSKFNDIFKGKF